MLISKTQERIKPIKLITITENELKFAKNSVELQNQKLDNINNEHIYNNTSSVNTWSIITFCLITAFILYYITRFAKKYFQKNQQNEPPPSIPNPVVTPRIFNNKCKLGKC